MTTNTKQLKLLDDLLMAASWSNHQLTLIAEMRIDVLSDQSLADSLEAFKREQESLPEIKPIKGDDIRAANGRKAPQNSALRVKCPTCNASPGAACFEMSRRGPGAVPTKKRRNMGQYHKSRTQLAKGESNGDAQT